MTAKALLEVNPKPTREEVVHWLEGSICRCTGYEPIVDAVLEGEAIGVRVAGQSVPRVDGPAKVTGRARYAIDLTLPGMAHGAVVRSDRAHARILSIETAEAEALPGVLKVVTGANVAPLDSALRARRARPPGAGHRPRALPRRAGRARGGRHAPGGRARGAARARPLRGPARDHGRRRSARQGRAAAAPRAHRAHQGRRARPGRRGARRQPVRGGRVRLGRRRRRLRGRRPRARGRIPLPDALRLRDGALQRDRVLRGGLARRLLDRAAPVHGPRGPRRGSSACRSRASASSCPTSAAATGRSRTRRSSRWPRSAPGRPGGPCGSR